MGHILSFSICSGLILAAMYLIYLWLLANEKQHSYNRAVLLSIYILAPALALFAPEATLTAADRVPETKTIPASAPDETDTLDYLDTLDAGFSEATPADSPLWLQAILIVWITGMAAVVATTIAGHIKVARIVASSEKRRSDGYTIALTDRNDISPFSFRRTIVISRSDYETSGDIIITHELRHIEGRHWIDLLVSRAVIAVNWFNPAVWMLDQELKSVHEFQADMAVINSGVDARQYQLLLIKKAVGRSFPAIANSLNHSSLKKRITMMLKSKPSKSRRLRALALVPAAVGAIFVTNLPAVASALESVSETTFATVNTDKDSQNSDAGQTHHNQLPQFPGGEKQLLNTLTSLIEYPEEVNKADAPENVRVIVKFTIETDGSIHSPQIARSGGEPFDKAAIKAIMQLPPFEPGTVDGEPVETAFVIPVTFSTKKSDENPADNQAKEQTDNQVDKQIEKPADNHDNQLPQFPGGEIQLLNTLTSLIEYPEEVNKADAPEKVRVIVKFTIGTDGSIHSPQIVRSGGEPFDKATIKVIMQLPPFEPGTVDGEPVESSFVIPVTFSTKKSE